MDEDTFEAVAAGCLIVLAMAIPLAILVFLGWAIWRLVVHFT